MSIESPEDLKGLQRVGRVVSETLKETQYRARPGVRTIDLDRLGGYIADAAITVAVPPVSDSHRRLCRCAQSALHKGLNAARAGRPIRHIGRAIQREVERQSFSVIPELTGHGVGRHIHEEPDIANYHNPYDSRRLKEGLVITIEPLICSGVGKIYDDDDGWTVRTQDGSYAAHFEHTLVIRHGKPLLLTAA